jgi:hypothetical protein
MLVGPALARPQWPDRGHACRLLPAVWQRDQKWPTHFARLRSATASTNAPSSRVNNLLVPAQTSSAYTLFDEAELRLLLWRTSKACRRAASKSSATTSAGNRTSPRRSNMLQRYSGMVCSYAPIQAGAHESLCHRRPKEGPLPVMAENVRAPESEHKRKISNEAY